MNPLPSQMLGESASVEIQARERHAKEGMDHSKPGPRLDRTRLRGALTNERPYRDVLPCCGRLQPVLAQGRRAALSALTESFGG